MSSIHIEKISITDLKTDAIVNAANKHLAQGAGVCGYIFDGAGAAEMTEACRKIGRCETGHAVITPGFRLPAKYVIHAVGPIWMGGDLGEPQLLYSAYKESLKVAKENDLHSIGFPLISAGIYGYPLEGAWQQAIQACRDFLEENSDHEMEIIFAVLDDRIKEIGERYFTVVDKNGGLIQEELTPAQVDAIQQAQATLSIEDMKMSTEGILEIGKMLKGEMTREQYQQALKENYKAK
ncbi:MAG: macro domain-containing protein [Lachnospiraceae bacterium]|nr:macro domain-containing protein [Lachnospiraceae bacterium]